MELNIHTDAPAEKACGRPTQRRVLHGRGADMASPAELIQAICKLVETSPVPIPITLMNHGVDEAAAIIGGVVERCPSESIALTRMSIDPELAEELGLTEGKVVEHGARPTIHCERGFGRSVRFERG
jgi:hypothetical protein